MAAKKNIWSGQRFLKQFACKIWATKTAASIWLSHAHAWLSHAHAWALHPHDVDGDAGRARTTASGDKRTQLARFPLIFALLLPAFVIVFVFCMRRDSPVCIVQYTLYGILGYSFVTVLYMHPCL